MPLEIRILFGDAIRRIREEQGINQEETGGTDWLDTIAINVSAGAREA
jgi:hypothetical protein